MSRNYLISVLLNEDISYQSKSRKKSCSKIACNCYNCNRLFVDPRINHLYKTNQSRNPLDLLINLMNLLSQSIFIEQDSSDKKLAFMKKDFSSKKISIYGKRFIRRFKYK